MNQKNRKNLNKIITECQIYLKECLEKEEYELAELIKKKNGTI